MSKTITRCWVDPSINANSGTGTVGDPYGDLQYAFDTETRDTTNGNWFNIKAGTAEVLAATIDLTTFGGAGLEHAPLVLAGYSTTENDGGEAEIDCNGYSFFNYSTYDHIKFKDLNIHGSGTNPLIHLDQNISIIRCRMHDCQYTNNNVWIGSNSQFIGNYFYDLYRGLFLNSGQALYNVIAPGTNCTDRGIGTSYGQIINNIVKIESDANGVELYDNSSAAIGNSIWSDAGSGHGIDFSGSSAKVNPMINNLIEGFSGTGGYALYGLSFAKGSSVYGNRIYDCANLLDAEILSYDDWLGEGNETLSASPFTDAANNDFSPVDTGGVKQGWVPNAFHSSF